MEFQCPEDDAWYYVNLFYDGEKLTVHYANFSEEYDDKYDVKMFNNMEELEEFRGRFRSSSVQVQDHDCKLIYQGKLVCALCYLEDDEVKFYDALVAEVLNEDRKFKQEEEEDDDDGEECTCTYVLRWQHGPLAGERTFAKINDICLTPFGNEMDPCLFAFLNAARDRIEKGAEHEELNLFATTSFVEAFFEKLRRRRKYRYAYRTSNGRQNGRCKRIELLTSDEDEDISTAS